jgi:TPR repeat protein
MKRVLLILLLLFGLNTIVMADDFEDGLAAYKSQDYATALEKFMKAATAVSPTLDDWLLRAKADNPDVSEADLRSYWQEKYGSREAQRRKAQFRLGVMYDSGRGVPEDHKQATQWLTKAAETGLGDAQFYLGMIYDKGRGVPKDNQQAVRWYTKAAEAGFVVAQFNLALMHEEGRGVPEDSEEAVYWFTKAAEAGFEEAQLSLAAL